MLSLAPTTNPRSLDIPKGQTERTVFVYDAGGKLIGEYSTNVETQAPKVQYLTADYLGAPRKKHGRKRCHDYTSRLIAVR